MGLFEWVTGGEPQPQPDESNVETVRRIARELDELEPDQARFVACFAYILGRVAHADLDISEDETRAMEELISERAGLPADQAVLVAAMAKQHNELFGGTENFLVTREFEHQADRVQKLALLDCLFAVSASDGSVSGDEDGEVRKIASELKLDHRDFIAARSRYLEHLEMLKDEPRP